MQSQQPGRWSLTTTEANINTSLPSCNTTEESTLDPIEVFCYTYLLPVITLWGVVGNCFSLFILRGGRLRRAMGANERGANCGLIALAVSDLLMCLFAFPYSFMGQEVTLPSGSLILIYRLYCSMLINTFIMSSTWLTVALATERYLAICHPLRSRRLLSLRRTKFAIGVIFFASILVQIPYIWRFESRACQVSFNDEEMMPPGSRNSTNSTLTDADTPVLILRRVEEILLFGHAVLDHSFRIFCAAMGNFLPLALLMYFNTRLMHAIHTAYRTRQQLTCQHKLSDVKSHKTFMAEVANNAKEAYRKCSMETQKSRSNSEASLGALSCTSMRSPRSSMVAPGLKKKRRRETDTSYRVTLTLVAIVVAFLTLVAPSETIKLTFMATGVDLKNNIAYRQADAILNVLQSLNFSLNFVLYCCFIRSFRKTVKYYCFHVIRRLFTKHDRSLTPSPRRYGRVTETRFSQNIESNPLLLQNSIQDYPVRKLFEPPRIYVTNYDEMTTTAT